jgi:preprotein translocase subunit SecE
MESIKTYIVGAYEELLHKVTWPTWAELQSSGIIVFTASAIIGIFVLIMDLASKNVTDIIYKFLMSL